MDCNDFSVLHTCNVTLLAANPTFALNSKTVEPFEPLVGDTNIVLTLFVVITLTVALELYLLPPYVKLPVIVAVPLPIPVTVPLELTVAMLEFDDIQDTVTPDGMFPDFDTYVVSPNHILEDEIETEILGLVTVTLQST